MKRENSRFVRLVAKWNGAFWDDPKTSALNRNWKANVKGRGESSGQNHCQCIRNRGSLAGTHGR
jgi:hypothetical protein